MAITLIDSSASNGSSGTTVAMDTTGANLLVTGLSGPGAAYTQGKDSKTNTWADLTNRANNTGGTNVRASYVVGSPTVGSGHTFEGATTIFYAGATAAAFSGASAFDQESGSSDNASGTSHAGSSGAVTPSENNCLLIHFITFGDSQNPGTITPPTGSTLLETANVSGSNNPIALAYEIQTTATARTPSWGTTNAVTSAAGVAVFTAAASSAGNPGRNLSLLGVG